jgi:hypothetical protein
MFTCTLAALSLTASGRFILLIAAVCAIVAAALLMVLAIEAPPPRGQAIADAATRERWLQDAGLLAGKRR